ncbi:uncharacterized protein LOC123876633 [Maniola jurtina]|uniref:uncharacterized protein LOC123876633 n=1 Tax=Maniola jurtina TaxID=191418 RepID=UPI001E68661C|nr:uncharacterized protein LOC123876633 [Maniola jurtina]XP_045778884.1 uncharacterized protein LOC123876633 [Maniola jurtina]XP_045778885.1 uncharacterized protein LOC123876633 [Maniola jurtina]XP_045778887.1 uncharacterized protein LOC123876633 [Maniola jurtina]
MKVKMCSLRVLSIVSLFVADVWTGTLQHKDSLPRKCHHCVHSATSNCELTAAPVLCPVGEPYCATIARTPNFTSSLTCAAAKESPCLLSFNSKLELEMNCICSEHLCNVPYSSQLRNELLNFSAKIPRNATGLTEMFLKSSVFVNVTKAELYKVITKVSEATERPTMFSSQSTTIALVSIGVSEIGPRAEALKHEATVPPDDDEDEGEGSGSFEEARTHAAPAAPSSYLPAEENKSTAIVLNLYLLLSSIFYFHAIL